MFYYYKLLPALLPQILLLARPGTEVILVSPWVEDIIIAPPILTRGASPSIRAEMRLSEFLLYLVHEHEIHVTFVVREGTSGASNERLAHIVAPLQDEHPDRVRVKRVPHLHAKPIVTESFVIHSSANILSTSFYRNIELCALLPNRYGSARKWVEVELGLAV